MTDDKIISEVMEKSKDEEFKERFVLDLDAFFTDSYGGGCYPKNDLDGRGHYGTCLLKDKEEYKKRFLLEMAKRFEIHGTIEKR